MYTRVEYTCVCVCVLYWKFKNILISEDQSDKNIQDCI